MLKQTTTLQSSAAFLIQLLIQQLQPSSFFSCQPQSLELAPGFLPDFTRNKMIVQTFVYLLKMYLFNFYQANKCS